MTRPQLPVSNSPPYRLQMHSGIRQQGSQQQRLASQILAERAMGWATCTVAFGSTLQPVLSISSSEPSEVNIFTFPSLPYKITFLLKMEIPCTATGPEAVHGISMYCHRTGGRRPEQIQRHIEEEGHIHRVEALIEGNRLQVQIHRQNFHIADSHIGGTVYQFLLGFWEKHPDVLEAVFIATRIIDSHGVDTDRFFKAPLVRCGTEIVFGHMKFLLCGRAAPLVSFHTMNRTGFCENAKFEK